MLPRGARRYDDRCNTIHTGAVRNFSNSKLALTTGIKIFRPLDVLPSAQFSRTDFGVASPKSANFRDHLANMCSAVLVRRTLPIHTRRSLKNKKTCKAITAGFHVVLLFSFIPTETTYTVWTWTTWKGSRPPVGRPPMIRCRCVWWKARASKTVTTTSKCCCPPANDCSRAVPERSHRNARGER